MSSYVQRSSQSFEQAQRTSQALKMLDGGGEAPQSGLLQYVSLIAEKRFFQQLTDLLQGCDWGHLPSDSWTLDFQTWAFRMTSCMGAAVQELLVEPTTRFPLKLFQLLVAESPTTLGQQMQGCRSCVLDDFSRQRLRRFGGEQLCQEDSLTCLRAMQRVASTETVGIEWGHGRVHRLTCKSSVQSQAPSLEYVSAQWLCQKVVQRAAHTWSGLPKVSSHATAPPAATGAEGERPSKKLRGGGGAWRSFVSMRQKGRTGPTDFQTLAVQYKEAQAANTPDYQEGVRLGAAATQRHKITGSSSSFGPRPREVTRQRLAAWMQTQALSVRVPEGLTPAPRLMSGDVLSLAVHTDLKQRLTQVRKAHTAARQAARLQKEEAGSRMATLCEQLQEPAMETLLQLCPGLLDTVSKFYYVPDEHFTHLEMVPDLVGRVTDIAGRAAANSRVSNVEASLQADWRKRHSTFNADDIHTAPSVPSQTPCTRYGLCLCSGDGKEIFSLRNHFLRLLKLAVPSRDLDSKSLLQDGWFVIELHSPASEGELAEWDDLLADYLAPPDSDSPTPPWARSSPIFVHVAMHYFKPYRPTFQMLHVVEKLEAEQHIMEQSGVFLTEFQLWSALDRNRMWHIRLHMLQSSSRPLPNLQPKQCTIKAWKVVETSLWPPPIKSSRRTQAKRAASGRRSQGPTAADRDDVGDAVSSSDAAVPAVQTADSEGEASADEGMDVEVTTQGSLCLMTNSLTCLRRTCLRSRTLLCWNKKRWQPRSPAEEILERVAPLEEEVGEPLATGVQRPRMPEKRWSRGQQVVIHLQQLWSLKPWFLLVQVAVCMLSLWLKCQEAKSLGMSRASLQPNAAILPMVDVF